MNKLSSEDNTVPPLPDSARLPRERTALRRYLLDWRQAVPASVHADWSARLCAQVLAWMTEHNLPGRQRVAFCWPVQNEPDVLPLVRAWQAAGVPVALPVVIAAGEALKFRDWPPGGELRADRYGIPTPLSGAWVQPDILLLPGNAFDHQGYRLGYGGGFFDRTLAALNPRPLAIGLCFDGAVVADLAPAAHDLPADVLVTESGVLLCRDKGGQNDRSKDPKNP